MFFNKLNKIALVHLIWIFPLVSLLHNLEEVMTMGAFRSFHLEMQSLPFYALMQSNDLEFAVSVGILTVIVFLITYLAAKNQGKGKSMDVFILALSLVFVNAIIHLIQALIFRSYVPGLITGLLLVLPYSFIIFPRIFQEKLINGFKMGLMLVLGLILQIPIIIGALWIGRILVPI